jgi:opacity protein-like surface antigen
MTNRRTMSFSILAAAFLALCLPMVAAAQWPDYGRNRDRNDRYGRYDERYLRDSIHRLDRLAKDFERDVDRSLDRSRRDGTRSEDQINNEARQFRNAVGNLKSRFGNGRDLNRSRNEAQRVLQEAQDLNRIGRFTNRSGQWSQIQQELSIIADAYNLGYSNGGYRNDRNRRNDDYRRSQGNNDWWRRIPFPN